VERYVKREVRVIVRGVGVAKAVLYRKYSPKTFARVVRSLPIEGYARLLNGVLYLVAPFEVGAEDPKKRVKRGDVAYWPLWKAICIFREDKALDRPVNLLGHVVENVEVLDRVERGALVRIEEA